MIAGHEYLRPTFAEVANCEGEHSIEASDAVRAHFFVEMQDNFGVGVGAEAMAFGYELAAEGGEVINFSVVGDPDAAIFIRHRHVAVGGKVEDGKPSAPQSDVGAVGRAMVPKAAVIGAAMRLHRSHPRQRFPVAAIRQSANAAHN